MTENSTHSKDAPMDQMTQAATTRDVSVKVKPIFMEVDEVNTICDQFVGDQDIYKVLVKSVESREYITGIQRINKLWRLYINSQQDRVKLITAGVNMSGRSIRIYDKNPYLPNDTDSTQVIVKDLPLSVADDEIRKSLMRFICKIKGAIRRKKLTVDGQLTSCLNGDRFFYVETLKTPLPRVLNINDFKARLFHKGQSHERIKCSKCLKNATACPNKVVCDACGSEEHRNGESSAERVIIDKKDTNEDDNRMSNDGDFSSDAITDSDDDDNEKGESKEENQTKQGNITDFMGKSSTKQTKGKKRESCSNEPKGDGKRQTDNISPTPPGTKRRRKYKQGKIMDFMGKSSTKQTKGKKRESCSNVPKDDRKWQADNIPPTPPGTKRRRKYKQGKITDFMGKSSTKQSSNVPKDDGKWQVDDISPTPPGTKRRRKSRKK